MLMVLNSLSIENNCNIHLTSGKELINFQGYRLVRLANYLDRSVHVIIMWAGSHTDLLSEKSVFIDIHWIHLMNQHSALLCTVYVHVVDDVAQT